MRHLSKKLMLATMLLVAIAFASCNAEIYMPLNKLSVDDMKTKTGKAAALTVNATIDAMNANGNSGETLVDIMRNTENRQGLYENIISEYTSALSSLDESADLETIALNEIAELVESGMTEEDAIRLIQEDVDRLSASEKAVYLKEGVTNLTFLGGGRWEGGVVRYYFDGLSERAKGLIRQAMDTWEDRTGCVRFVEVDYDFGKKICSALGQYECLHIMNNDEEGCSNCTVGSGNHKKMRIAETGLDATNDKTFLRTIKHELGHCLGLYHEHQRYDRDRYVTISDNESVINGGRIPQKTVYFGYKVIHFLGLRIYIPYVWYGQFSFTVGEFDFDSIMLYGGLEIKAEYANDENGIHYYGTDTWCTRYNYEISENDVKAVRIMYGAE